jgi:hypothetical protein
MATGKKQGVLALALPPPLFFSPFPAAAAAGRGYNKLKIHTESDYKERRKLRQAKENNLYMIFPFIRRCAFFFFFLGPYPTSQVGLLLNGDGHRQGLGTHPTTKG